MKNWFLLGALMTAAPVQATELLGTGGFVGTGSATVAIRQYDMGVSAAQNWSVWNNTAASTFTAVVPRFEGRDDVLHVTTDGKFNGVYQFFAPSARSGYADFWVASGQAMYLAAFDGSGLAFGQTFTTGSWERVFLNSGSTVFNEVTLYSFGGSADFYVSGVSARADAAAVPEPKIWAMLIAGFGLIGAAMRVRSRTVRLI